MGGSDLIQKNKWMNGSMGCVFFLTVIRIEKDGRSRRMVEEAECMDIEDGSGKLGIRCGVAADESDQG